MRLETRILWALKQGDASAGELARELGIRTRRISEALEYLEAVGLLQRKGERYMYRS
jgi:DNA-binding HxlR family transcriptional regulator